MAKANDLSRSCTVLEQNSTLIAVIEMSLSSWPVAGIVPGLARHPLKKLGADADALLLLLHRWREEAAKCGHPVARIAVAFEASRDGFGWRVGCARVASRPSSSTLRASRCHASTDGPKPTGSTPSI
jgi:hypothetical protein